MSFKAGVTVSGKFGPVEISSNASFARTVHRRIDKKYKRFCERCGGSFRIQYSNIGEKYPDTYNVVRNRRNQQPFVRQSCGGGNTNISGIYRWVDKLYEAQVYNYGQRPMFQFIIPEPAALYIYSRKINHNPY